LRIDEDVKKACTVTLLNSRQIRGSSDFLRSTGGAATSSSGRSWEHDHVCRAQASALIAFEGWRLVRIALDGSRVGKPAEETYVYHLWESTKNLFFPLAPQVTDDTTRTSVGTFFYSVLKSIFYTLLRLMF